MAKDTQKSETFSTALMLIALVVTLASCYWQAAPQLETHGLTNKYVNMALLVFGAQLSRPMAVKLFTYLMVACSAAFRIGKKVNKTWKHIISYSAAGTVLFFLMPTSGGMYAATSLTGLGLSIYGLSLIFRKLKDAEEPGDDEGFEQNTELKDTKDSINIPYTFVWKGKTHKGWINTINPFRASMVLGSPGSGKSFAIYNAFIEQTIRKGYTMFLYDYKFPDLTERVLTEIAYQSRHEGLWRNMNPKPHLYVINFDDPMKSNRCNPINHTYITDPADTSEIADLVFLNINKGGEGKGFDFFNESAKVYLDAIIWWLANFDEDAVYNNVDGLLWVKEHRGQEAYDNLPREAVDNPDGSRVIDSKTDYVNKGKYCTFPHVIEVMAYNYKKTFQILQFTRGLEAKISPFASALEGGAMEQLQGQIASAQIPLGKFVSPALYWVMTGDDFTLDFNNPKEPKIICMGNNPDRQSIYGTTLALYTSRMFKLINHKHKLKSTVLLDEVPTIFIKGLDNLIATARSNKVAIVLGAQDKSQLRRDYGEKESEVIMTTVGNVFSGSVEGRTAKDISDAFGKEYRRRVSTSINDSGDGNSRSISYQLEDILPASRIVDMTQGTFCGWVKDNFGEEIKRKKFYGAVTVDNERNKRLDAEAQGVPVITNLFGERLPDMSETERDRLRKIYPSLAADDEAIYKEYIKELVRKEVDRNFTRIKEEVSMMIEREYERTTPLATRYREENGIDS